MWPPRVRPIAVRWAIGLVSVFSGWIIGLLAYLATANASIRDGVFWAIWTGAFSAVAWLTMGLLLALLDPRLDTAARAITAIVACGFVGVSMTWLVSLRTWEFSLLAFVTASATMSFYVCGLRVLRRRKPDATAA